MAVTPRCRELERSLLAASTERSALGPAAALHSVLVSPGVGSHPLPCLPRDHQGRGLAVCLFVYVGMPSEPIGQRAPQRARFRWERKRVKNLFPWSCGLVKAEPAWLSQTSNHRDHRWKERG